MSIDQTLQSIADVLAANEQHMVPRDPNQPEPHWRDITGLPEPRPVPSPEDRMADARTDTPHTFRTYLDATERDQLDARAAAAEQERDEAQARVSELLAFIGANESLSRAAELTEELALARSERDDYRVARDVARQTAAFRQGVIDRHRQELGAAGDVLAVVRDAAERIDRALATYDTTPGEACSPPCQPLGSPSPRAQDEPGRRSETGCMGDPDTELRLAGVHPDQEATRSQGYADAIAALRDDERYMDWWSSTGVKPAGTVREHLAAYLETVGPDGPDVTAPQPTEARP